jgi:transcriptional regulator with XRE-family HTH domain
MNIGNAIQWMRKQRDLTQVQLAKRCKIAQTSLSQIEKGHKYPSQKTLAKIAKALNTSIAAIELQALEEKDFPGKEAYKTWQLGISPSLEMLFKMRTGS